MPDLIRFGVPPGGLSVCKNLLPLDDKYARVQAAKTYSTDAVSNIQPEQFTGSGLDDVTISGRYTGTVPAADYRVKIDGTGTPDTFTWSNDGGSTWEATGVAITGSAQVLELGVSVTFAATTGHTSGDLWDADIEYYQVNSAVEMRSVSGSYYGIIGTGHRLYRLDTDKGLTDKSLAGGYLTGDNPWNFVQYGDWAIATNYIDTPQILKSFDGVGLFVDMAEPPNAKYCLFHKGHLIFAYLNDGTVTPKKIIWSALESPEDFAAALATGADGQDFPDANGEITGLAKIGDNFAIFHEYSITMGYYAGAPYTFNFRPSRAENIGCFVPTSLISVGDAAFFWGEDDIYMFDGQNAKSIGLGVKETVLDNLTIGYKHKVKAVHDAPNGIIYWAYPSGGSTFPNKILVYNYRKSAYTLWEIDCETLWQLHTGAIDMDSIDSIYPDISDMPYHMDSRQYQADTNVPAIMDITGYVATLDGATITSEIETGEHKDGNKILFVDRVRPRVANSTGTVKAKIGYRFEENDDFASYSEEATVGANGYADIRASGRYLRTYLTITGDHDGLLDIEIPDDGVKPAGRR
jgi:hypothetical protein